MAIITVPDSVRAFLTNLSECVEFRDANGNSLGTFTPQKVAEDEMYDEIIKSFDLEEADRLMKEFRASGEKGYTGEEIIAELKELDRVRCHSE